jgi:signal transduction histidine kinase
MGKAQTVWGAIVVGIISATVILVWVHLRTYLAADHEVVLAREAQRRLYELTLVLQDAENGARGYLLTNDQRQADVFDRASANTQSRMGAAEAAISGIGREESFASIKSMIAERLSLLGQARSLAAQGQPADAMQIIKSESADQLGLALRQEVVGLMEFTNALLEQRLKTCRQSMVSMTRWVMLGLGALIISGAGLVSCLIRETRYQRRITAELTRARDGALAAAHARDDFLNALSHELRTPLTPALLMVSAMEKRTAEGTEQRAELAIVRRQLELEARLIDDLLDVSRILRGDVVLRSERVSVHTIINHLCKTRREDFDEAGLSLECQLNAPNDRVMGSESRLHQVFWHVLSNAIKFTPEQGKITLTTSNENGKLIVICTDTGVGMSADRLPTIFEAFATVGSSRSRRFGGLGVGLAIVKSVVEMHAGNVTVQSDGKDKGATFRIELPTAG